MRKVNVRVVEPFGYAVVPVQSIDVILIENAMSNRNQQLIYYFISQCCWGIIHKL